jgi:hypothetical protein
MVDVKIVERKTNDLHFDRENPRLAEFGISSRTPEPEILSILWDTMDVAELAQSMAASGFFPHEPLMIVHEHGKDVVVEGNRRLAALKVLTHPEIVDESRWDIPKITDAARQKLTHVPVIVIDRQKLWRFFGFKHVNGPAKWSSFAKATYIAEVHRDYKVPLPDIAEQIGDRHKTVQRLFRGLMVLDQAEKMSVFDREDRYNTKFAFSHLYTGLDYDGIADFLKIKERDEETDKPVPSSHKKQLGEVLRWMYGSKKQSQPPVIQSQNPHLRYLDAALKSTEAVAALRDGKDILAAYELSRAPDVVFEEALLRAKRELQRAQASLTGGYTGSEDLLRIAGTVVELAEDVYSSMERKRPGAKRKRMTEER